MQICREAAGTFTEQRHVVGIATEAGNVFMDPPERHQLLRRDEMKKKVTNRVLTQPALANPGSPTYLIF